MESRLAEKETELAKKERRLQDVQSRLEKRGGAALDAAAIAREAVLTRRAEAWQHRITRKHWLLSGEMPATCDLQAGEMRDMLRDVPLQVSPAVMDQISTLAGFRIEVYLPRPSGSTPTVSQKLTLLMDDLLLKVVGQDVRSHLGRARVTTLHGAFLRSVNTVRSHEIRNLLCGAVRGREIHDKLVLLVNDGLSKWASALFDAAVSAGQKRSSPP